MQLGNGRLKAALWMAGAVCCALAVGQALWIPTQPPRRALDPTLSIEAWRFLAQHEVADRARAAADFPSDRWSQDDAFAAFQATRADEFARAHQLSIQDVLRAFDEGMRAKWELPTGTPAPRPTVSPLKPRPID